MTKAFSVLLVLLLCALPPRAQAAPARVYQITYQGWHNAYRLSNGTVDVIVVPAIGRIMAYQLAGQAQTNALWQAAALRGKPLPFAAPYPPRALAWTNYGGDKMWPAPQSDWPQAQHQKDDWPPDPQMDYGPYRVSRLPDGLRLSGPVTDNRGVRVVRDIRLAPQGTQVTLQETFQMPPQAAVAGDTTSAAPAALPLSLWNIAQVRADARVFVPLNPASRFAEGFVALAGTAPQPNWQVGDGLLMVTVPQGDGNKAGIDAAQGWIAAQYGALLFAERVALVAGAEYPNQNTPLQVYAQGDYVEMEVLGPLMRLAPEQAITRTLTWTLRRLPRAPRSSADARRLVKSEMMR